MSLSLRVLGPLAVERASTRVPLGGSRLQLLLGVLVAHRAAELTTEQLGDAVWGGTPPPSATATIQSNLSRLRRFLKPEAGVESRGSGYALLVPPGTVDADNFEGALAACSSLDDLTVVATLGEALTGWRGPAFGELADNPWIRPEAVRLDELRLAATERWIDARLALGEHAATTGDLERLVAVHPLREAFWLQLMLALYRSGRQAEALRRADELAQMLRGELGLGPSPGLRDLEQRMLRDDPSLQVPRRERLLPSTSRIVDVPTRLVGRDADVERLGVLIATERLVTLVGPGGVGKTRLARRVAADVAGSGRSAALVDLAAVRDPASTAPAVATALDVQPRQHETVDDTLSEVLREREQVVVLDNCEHVIGAIAGLVRRLTAACPSLHLLATSRERLGVPGEVLYTVAPLAVAAADDDLEAIAASPAVQLFVDRATAASPDFTVTSELVPVLGRLCRRLDGLPLAIELAAVRARAIAPQAMVDRLDRRFSMLDAGPRHADPRHRNLQSLMEWSYDLLTVNEQRLFARLSIFAGDFELDSVEAICATEDERVELVFGLIDRSMVQVESRDEPRYRLLETLRQFGRDRLQEAGAADALHGRHLRWFLDMAEAARVGMDGPDERAWGDRLERTFDDLRAAQAYAVGSGDVDAALRLVVALPELGFRRIRYEVTSWAASAAHMEGADAHPAQPLALAMVAYGHFVRGDLDAATAVGAEAVDLASHLGVDAGGLAERALGNAYFYLGDNAAATGWMDRMVASARTTEEPARLAHALYMRSVAATSLGHAAAGAAMAVEADAAAQSCGAPTALAQAAYAHGVAIEASDPVAGRGHLWAAVEHATEAGNRWVEAFARTEVLWIDARLGRVESSLRGYRQVVETWYRGGDWANQWLSIRHVSGILGQLGDDDAVAVIQGGLATARATQALPFEPADAARLRVALSQARQRLGATGYETLVGRGAAMGDHELVAYALDRIDRALAGRP